MATNVISPDRLKRLQESGSMHALLDVRERGEYGQEQIFGSVPVPRGQLESKVVRLIPWTDVPIIAYCDDGFRSERAAETLQELGYRDVAFLEGGIEGWKAAGYESTYGVNVLGKDYGEKVSVQDGIVQLKPQDVYALQQQGDAIVLDSRTREEYENAHLPGAYSVPGGELPVTALSLLESAAKKDTAVVVNCAGRTRSILGADILRRLGIERVYALENGTMAWTMAGLELEHGSGSDLHVHPTETARERAAQFAERFAEEEGVQPNSVDGLQLLQSQSAKHYIVDVRLPEEYEAGHIPGSISCPGGQLANALDEDIAVRQARIICVSDGMIRSRVGAAICTRIGYPDVVYLDGGLNAWREAGHEVESGWPRPDVPGVAEAQQTLEFVSPEALKAERGSSDAPTLIDVRRSSQFALEHIPGSIWVPRGDLERRIDQYVSDANAPIVLVSDHGERAALAGSTLQSMGYTQIRILDGGITAWKRAGFSIEDGLDGADVSLREAKHDAELVRRAPMLQRDRQDMVEYLEWEEKLGEKYRRE